MSKSHNGERPKNVLNALRDIAHATSGDKISMESFSKGLGRRSYGLLMLTLNLPNLIPLPLPFLSVVFGFPLALVAIQLAFGMERPWMPHFLRQRGIKKKEMLFFCDQVDQRYGWFHKLIHPRWPIMTRGKSVRLIGFAIFVLASTMVLPIPFGNLVLAVPIAIMSLGLIERDGVLVSVGLLAGMGGLALNLIVGSSIFFGMLLALKALFS